MTMAVCTRTESAWLYLENVNSLDWSSGMDYSTGVEYWTGLLVWAGRAKVPYRDQLMIWHFSELLALLAFQL